MNFYIPKHFKVEELVPPDLFHAKGAAALIVMDARILWTLDQLREVFDKPITVNNWLHGGQFSQRGYRNDPGTGAPLSQHRYGRAVDLDIAGVSAAAFRAAVREGTLGGPGLTGSPLEHVTGIEETANGEPINWIHLDCGNRDTTHGIVFIQA